MGRKWCNEIWRLHPSQRHIIEIKRFCWRTTISWQPLLRKIQRSWKTAETITLTLRAPTTLKYLSTPVKQLLLTTIQFLEHVSDFFKNGDLGYSPNKDKLDGLRLKTYKWEVRTVRQCTGPFFQRF